MCYHVLMAILLPVGPNLVDEGMVEKKLWCIGWCHLAHVSSHSAVHGVMEVDSKVKLKPGEAVVRRLKILSYVDGYYVGRQSCVAKINNEDNVSEKNQKKYEKQINNIARQVNIHDVTIDENWNKSDWRTMENVFINIRKPDAFHVESKLNTVEMELTPYQQTLLLWSWSMRKKRYSACIWPSLWDHHS